jgi:hypothetical protein
MAPGLGALFADTFPEVPALADIHEGFTFSKNDSFASLSASPNSTTCWRRSPPVPLAPAESRCSTSPGAQGAAAQRAISAE